MKICTHNGRFHCDEVTAVAMLSYIYDISGIIRTRDIVELEKYQNDSDTMVIDVGKIYDHSRKCYDHHQVTFTDSFNETYKEITPLSSCGLIYRHYGMSIVKKLAGEVCNDTILQEIYDSFYKSFVLPIDAGDNGVDYCHEKRYSPIILSSTISCFNEPYSDDPDEQLSKFLEAVKYSKTTFLTHLSATIKNKLEYYRGLAIFNMALQNTPCDLQSEGILIVDEMIPVNTYLLEFDPNQNYKFIIVKNNGSYKLWTVEEKGKRFATLKKLISEESARSEVGDSLVFIHKTGFTGETKTLESAITICKRSLNAS